MSSAGSRKTRQPFPSPLKARMMVVGTLSLLPSSFGKSALPTHAPIKPSRVSGCDVGEAGGGGTCLVSGAVCAPGLRFVRNRPMHGMASSDWYFVFMVVECPDI